MTQKNDGLSKQEAERLFGKGNRTQKKNVPQTQSVRIHNLSELKKMVNRLKPEANEAPGPIIINTKGTNMSDETFSGAVTIPQSGGQSTLRQTILDGFEMVKNHREYYTASLASQSEIEEYGGFPPALAPNPDEHMTWLDYFIDRQMGGRRVGLHIIWEIPEGKFRLDPWSCKLEKLEGEKTPDAS